MNSGEFFFNRMKTFGVSSSKVTPFARAFQTPLETDRGWKAEYLLPIRSVVGAFAVSALGAGWPAEKLWMLSSGISCLQLADSPSVLFWCRVNQQNSSGSHWHPPPSHALQPRLSIFAVASLVCLLPAAFRVASRVLLDFSWKVEVGALFSRKAQYVCFTKHRGRNMFGYCSPVQSLCFPY